MMEQKDIMCLYKLLRQQGCWADFARRVLDAGLDIFFGSGSLRSGRALRRRCRRKPRQINGLRLRVSIVQGSTAVRPTARIHQPCSSSLSTIRDFSVSTDSTGLPFENVLQYTLSTPSPLHRKYS